MEPLGGTTLRRMFGGAGLYRHGVLFALIADDTLYFKVDEGNRADYQTRGMEPFRPYAQRATALSYYEVPVEVIEDGEAVLQWAGKALAAARRSGSK